MGLDVYLKKCNDLSAAKAAEEAFELESDGLWADSVSDEERDAKLEALMVKHNTDKWGSSNLIETVEEINSTIDPEHYFKVGYFRSSYNDSGINAVMRRAGLASLDAIFDAPNDGGDVTPDWSACLARANEAIEKYQAFLGNPGGDLRVMEVRPMWEFGANDAKEALDLYIKDTEKAPSFGAWSSREGEFMPKGVTLRAVITKKFENSNSNNPIERFLNRPSFFLVMDKEQTGKEDWHLTALRIVKETIEYVMAQPDSNTYYLRWSG